VLLVAVTTIFKIFIVLVEIEGKRSIQGLLLSVSFKCQTIWRGNIFPRKKCNSWKQYLV